ncbi:MAG: ATP-binding protein [Pseudomonadota bacterium]
MSQIDDSFESTAVFARVLSHDLGSLVRTARHLSGYIREDVLRQDLDSAMHALGMLDLRLASLDRFIAELIRFYRAGQRTAQIEEFSVSTLARDVFQRGKFPATAKLQVSASHDLVLTDRTMLKTVLTELIENALIHHPEPDKIVVSVDVSQSQDGRTIIIVRDNGTGLQRLDPHRALQPFVKDTERTNAAGLGLAICKRELEAAGGEICLQAAGGGLAVAVLLPTMADLPSNADRPDIRPLERDRNGPDLRIV